MALLNNIAAEIVFFGGFASQNKFMSTGCFIDEQPSPEKSKLLGNVYVLEQTVAGAEATGGNTGRIHRNLNNFRRSNDHRSMEVVDQIYSRKVMCESRVHVE